MLLTAPVKAKILEFLSRYVGASAPWVLAQSERRAASLEELSNILAGVIPKHVDHQNFLNEINQLLSVDVSVEKNADSTENASGAEDPTGLSELPKLTVRVAELRLMQFIGDNADNATASLVPAPKNVEELYQRLSALITDPSHRQRFLALTPTRNSNV